MQGVSGPRRAAFTLIELLIVVAIIAILALIAVPNFLEAQTRAKVSRVRSDLRTVAVAQEAYYIDWNSYTVRNLGGDNPWADGAWTGFRMLTTPVAYLTSIPMDPFGITKYKGELHPGTYEIGAGVAGVAPTGPLNNLRPEGFPSNTYVVESDGPDHWDDSERDKFGFDLGTGSYPWADLPDTPEAATAVLGIIYDPTNGTVSAGEVYRPGGTKPAGRAHDLYWQGAALAR